MLDLQGRLSLHCETTTFAQAQRLEGPEAVHELSGKTASRAAVAGGKEGAT